MADNVQTRTEFEIGECATISKEITEEDIDLFARITGDYNPVHIDSDFANRTRFKGRIAHGMLTAGLISAVLGTKLPGPGSIYLGQTLKFLRPVRIGDQITTEVCVTAWNLAKRILQLNTRCFNQSGEDVLTGDAVLLVENIQS
jgi:3-hydroxybutyryl-CoA dehydratase